MARRKAAPADTFALGAPPQPAKAPPPDEAVKRLVDAFHGMHFARFGCYPIRPEYGRFAKELKEMLATVGEAGVAALMGDFFAKPPDPQVNRTHYRPMDFVRLAQYLQLKRRDGGPLDQRTAENADAAARATGAGRGGE